MVAKNVRIGQTVESLVFELISLDYNIQDALYREYANLSALSRLLKNEIKRRYGREVSLTAVMSAVKRSRTRIYPFYDAVYSILSKSSVSVRTNVAKLSISDVSMGKILSILREFEENFIHISESLSAITLIFDESIMSEIKRALQEHKILEDKMGLAAITLHSPREIISTPGCALIIYSALAKFGINIEDTTSCYTSTIIVVEMKDVERAFSALTSLISYARERAKGSS